MDRKSIAKITKFLVLIGLIIQAGFIIPLITSFIYFDKNFIEYYIVCTIFFIFLYGILYKVKLDLNIKEAILSVNLVWILGGIIGAGALMITSHISFIDGFFESVSGFTTTGATIYTHISNLPKTTLMLRSTMHWLGGMGIIVLGLGIIAMINPTASLALFKSESTGITASKITPKLKHTAANLWKIYILITIIDLLLLKIEGMNWFDAINHAFATVSTGGFSTKDESMGYWINNSLILWTTTIFMIISSINFVAHYKALKGDFQGYKSEEVKWFLRIFISLSLILGFIHYFSSKDSLFFAMTNSFFTIASIITTTGFATLDYSTWGNLAIAIIFIAMFIGGNAGSTAGGVKVIRYIVMFKNLKYQIKKLLFPNTIFFMKIDNTPIKADVLSHVGAFFFLYILTNAIIALYLFASGYDTLTSISAAIASVGNIGPGFGHVGPVDNFAFFTPAQKIVLSIGMIIGRLEFFTVFILFYKDFWKK